MTHLFCRECRGVRSLLMSARFCRKCTVEGLELYQQAIFGRNIGGNRSGFCRGAAARCSLFVCKSVEGYISFVWKGGKGYIGHFAVL